MPHIVKMDGAPVSTTNQSLTTVKTIPIKGGSLGPNGILEADLQLSFSSTGTTKEIQLHAVGVGGDYQFWQGTNTGTGSQRLVAQFRNQNNAAVQVAHPQSSAGAGNVAGTPLRGAIDTTQDFQIEVRIGAYTSPDIATVEHVAVSIKPGA
ncbi:MAG: hypothetical protein ACTHKB_15740, partial [Burkholderiaceae bacterium]